MTSREQFDRQAAHYNDQWNQWSEASLRWLLEHAQCAPSDRLLDVATGTGFTALAFAPLVDEVVGLDVSEGMLSRARAQAAGYSNVTFEQGAAEELPFADSRFEIVTCRVAPHHFLSVEKFLTEAGRVLRGGGRLLIADTSVPDDPPEAGLWQNRVELLRDPSHIQNYSPKEWQSSVEQAGFQIETIDRCDEAVPITLNDWLHKAGCAGAAAEEVRGLFAQAPESARRAFAIHALPDGDTGFHWMRVVLSARKC
jgi:ubiquinone/menaquinone biosynthesis C-methylase UbiE